MESGLTYEEIVEILLRQEELLELYRSQLKELTKEYDADDELIELTQLRSPRLGVTGGGSNQKGLDQICQAVEQQRKAYREAVYEEMQRVLAAYNRVQKVHLCYLHLPQKQKAVLEGLYIKKKMYKELEGPGLSEKHGTHFSISRDFWPTCGIPAWKRAEPCNIACGHGGHYG